MRCMVPEEFAMSTKTSEKLLQKIWLSLAIFLLMAKEGHAGHFGATSFEPRDHLLKEASMVVRSELSSKHLPYASGYEEVLDPPTEGGAVPIVGSRKAKSLQNFSSDLKQVFVFYEKDGIETSTEENLQSSTLSSKVTERISLDYTERSQTNEEQSNHTNDMPSTSTIDLTTRTNYEDNTQQIDRHYYVTTTDRAIPVDQLANTYTASDLRERLTSQPSTEKGTPGPRVERVPSLHLEAPTETYLVQEEEIQRQAYVNSLSQQDRKLLNERIAMAREWAPLIYLHPDELYFPGDVHHFLANVETNGTEWKREKRSGRMYKQLPSGEESEHLHLTAPLDTECCNCPLPGFLYGNYPQGLQVKAPVYTQITSCYHPEEDSIDYYLSSEKNSRKTLRRRLSSEPLPFLSLYKRAKKMKKRGAIKKVNDNASFPIKRSYDASSTVSSEKQTNSSHDSFPIPWALEFLKDNTKDVLKHSKVSFRKPSKYSGNKKKLAKTRNGNNSNENTRKLVRFETIDSSTASSDVNNATEILEERYDDKQNEGKQQKRSAKATKGHHFTVTYWLFYPYNRGKDVCTTNVWLVGRVAKPLFKGRCLGQNIVMGNHVGDWEHLSIFFEDGEAKHLYISSHNFGAYYTYNKSLDRFEYSSQDVRKGLPVSVDYPEFIERVDGKLALYSALGSHGLWPMTGTQKYNSIMVPLTDETEKGYKWDIAEDLRIIDSATEQPNTTLSMQWLQFRGHWGNPSNKCHPGLLGFCEINSGPTGIPMKRINFPCSVPNHYTFPNS